LKSRTLLCSLAIASVLFLTNIPSFSQELRPAREKPPGKEETTPPVIRSHLKPSEWMTNQDLPTYFNWNDLGYVTSVKDQLNFSACWAFTCLADLESKILIDGGSTYDFSELNVMSCNVQGICGYTGGHSIYAVNYLSLFGSTYEWCDPYPGSIPDCACINPACPFTHQVTDWILLPNDIAAIKNAVYNYGPVQIYAYTDPIVYATYVWPGCIDLPNEPANHHMLIVGWWDDLCSGAAWIVKNTYNDAWGWDGYALILQGGSSIEQHASMITGYKAYNGEETILYWDEYGWMNETGYGDGEDWGLVKFTPASTLWLGGVTFWATSGPIDYDIYVYDDFDGSVPGTLRFGPLSGTFGEAGLHTITLPYEIKATAGDDINIVIRFDTHGYANPIPFDDSGPMETGKSFISNNGAGYVALDDGLSGFGDIGIRGRFMPSASYGDPGIQTILGETRYSLYPGESGGEYVILKNYGSVSNSPCVDGDSFCVDYDDPDGLLSYSDIPEGSGFYLGAGASTDNAVLFSVPCDAEISAVDTVVVSMHYWRNGACRPELEDCTDPSISSGNSYASSHTFIITVIEAPPPFQAQETGAPSPVNEGQRPVSVPVTICNYDVCFSGGDCSYLITSRGYIGSPIYQTGTESGMLYGECRTIYAVLDASGSIICDRDTLTIICWDAATESFYDTCLQAVHVTEYTDAGDTPAAPESIELFQNHPNPFNPSTEIHYALSEACRVRLTIYSVNGRRIAKLLDEYQEAGYKSVIWDGTNDTGAAESSGIYFYLLEAKGRRMSRKMILLR
jgi:C1A family cysteine protease